MSSFPTAAQAREQAQSYSVISVEVQAIETAILAVLTANSTDPTTAVFQATVTDNTAMTNSTPVDAESQKYFNVFKGTVTDGPKTEQMAEVIKHFTDKGYAVERITAAAVSSDTFFWQVDW